MSGQQTGEAYAAMSGVRKAIENNSNSASKYYRFQFWFLALGVAEFIAWRVLDMIRLVSDAP